MARGVNYAGSTLPITDLNYTVSRNIISEKSMGNPAEASVYAGGYSVSGSFGGVLRPGAYAKIIERMMCVASATNKITGVGDFNASATQASVITISDEFDNKFAFASCAITSMEISIRTGDFAKATFNWVASGEVATASTSSLTSADYTEKVPVFYNSIVTIGSSTAKLTGFTMRINRPIDASDFILGTEYTQSLMQSDSLTIEGTFEMAAKDWSMIQSAIFTGDTGSYDPSTTTKNSAAYTGGATVTLRKPDGTANALVITLGNLICSEAQIGASGRQRFTKTINWRAAVSQASDISFAF